jgi:uncharacterized protein RhaS with RHS repeats
MQARYYDPVIGRFYSNDPVGFRDVHSFNRYAYANNNPYKYTDPDGRLPILIPIAIFIAKELASEAVEQVTGVPMPTLKNAGKLAAKQLAKNRLKGKAGEALTKKGLGKNLGGEQVSFKNSEGKIARIDFTTKNKTLVETKTGNAKLSKNQKQLQTDIDNGVAVTPVGKNAANAGFKPGVPVKIEKMEIDRHQ